MTTWSVTVRLTCLLFLALATALSSQSTQTIRRFAVEIPAGSSETRIAFQLQCATSGGGDITCEDVAIRYDGLPLDVLRQELRQFHGDSLAVAIVVYNNTFAGSLLTLMKDAAARLLDQLGATDEVAIIPAHTNSGVSRWLRGDDAGLRSRLDAITPGSDHKFEYGTSLGLDALSAVQAKRSKAIICVYADKDEGGGWFPQQHVEWALAMGVRFYGISVSRVLPDTDLERTGGFGLRGFSEEARRNAASSIIGDLRRNAVGVTLATPRVCPDGKTHELGLAVRACGDTITLSSSYRIPLDATPKLPFSLSIAEELVQERTVVNFPLKMIQPTASKLLSPFTLELHPFQYPLRFIGVTFDGESLIRESDVEVSMSPPRIRVKNMVRLESAGALFNLLVQVDSVDVPAQARIRLRSLTSDSPCDEPSISIGTTSIIPSALHPQADIYDVVHNGQTLQVRMVLAQDGAMVERFDSTLLHVTVAGTPRRIVSASYDSGTQLWLFQVDFSCGDGRPRLLSTEFASTAGPLVSSKGFTTASQFRTISPSGHTWLCPGDSAVLDAGPGFASYRWSTGDTTRSIVVRKAANYQVQVGLDASGCAALFIPETVGMSTPRKVSPGPVVELCRNGYTELSIPIDGLKRVQWSTGDSTTLLRVTRPGLYHAMTTDAAGCVLSTDTVMVVEIDSLKPVIEFSGPTQLCPGAVVHLNLEGTWEEILWSTGATTPWIAVQDPGRVSVLVRNRYGCQGSASIDVLKHPAPQPRILWRGGHPTFCRGSGILLKVEDVSTPRTWSTGDTTWSTVLKEAGEVFYTVHHPECDARSETLTFGYYPDADTPRITRVADTLFANTLLPNVFAWFLNGAQIPTAGSQRSIVVTQTGTYTVRLTNQYGCHAMSLPFVVSSLTSIEAPLPLGKMIEVYPQPAEGTLTVRVGESGAAAVRVTLTDVLGREFARREAVDVTSDGRITLNVQALPRGNYLLVVERGAQRDTRTVLLW